jgi:hypothetical protein
MAGLLRGGVASCAPDGSGQREQRVKSLRFYGGVFIVAAASLMLQVVQTRILSVVAWYYMAFLAISVAMFGMTAGALWIYLRRQRFSERTLSHDLAYFSSALALSIVVSSAMQMTLASGVISLSVTTLVVWIEIAACQAVPFFFSGVAISLALTRSPFPIGRVYGADLAGAAVGCLLALLLLNLVDGPTALIWIAALAMVAASCFRSAAIGGAPATPLPAARQLLRLKTILAVLVLAALANGAGPLGMRPLVVKGKVEGGEMTPLYAKWNTFSRIAVFDLGRSITHLWGPSPLFKPETSLIEQRLMNIDGNAATVSYGLHGDVARAAFLKDDVTNIAHFLPGHERAAVIGIGAGRDMLSARVFGVPDITGIELNPILAHLLADIPQFAAYSGIAALPGMHIHIDEARSWFARSTDHYDIIQMTLIDTWAATSAGAFTLSENGLYTVEAWQSFIDHLNPQGVFTVSRWYAPDNVNEAGRMISLATATLLRLGAADPSRHIFVASSGRVATLVLSRSPFRAEDVALLQRIAREKQYKVLLSPGGDPASPVLGRIAASTSLAELAAYTATLDLDLSPPTDERPFFFNTLPLLSPWRAFTLARHSEFASAVGGNIWATLTLLFLFLLSMLVVVRTIVYPLAPAISDVGRRLAIGGSAYFCLIGAGFMMAEIGLVQRMSVFLGHPVYALSIVLFSLILSTGIGSLISDRFPLATRPQFTAWGLTTAAYLFSIPFWLPDVLHASESGQLLLRASVCIAAIAPVGVLMGYGFPTGMRLVTAVDRTPAPWFWGINGACGVLASSLAVATSLALGISATMIASALCYALLVPAGLLITLDSRTLRPATA